MNSGFQIHSIQNSSERLVGVLKSIANTDRLLILCHVAKAELKVSQIENLTKISQPTLSQQLMVLRKSNMVQTRRDGKQIFYSIKDPKILEVLRVLHTLYCS